MKNYKNYLLPLACVLVCILLWNTMYDLNEKEKNSAVIPSIQEEENNSEKDKSRTWTEQEAQEYAAGFEMVRQSIQEAKSLAAKGASSFTDVSLLGTWKNRGPYNMPGTFQFCELDEGTDTVYAVTFGHYGGVQFIWKGLLAGDNWTLINPKNPSRFEDLIVIPNGTKRRVIVAHQEGKIMYTDNGGKAWIYSGGIPTGIQSTIVNRQDNNVLYATDGKMVYRSLDKGATFSAFFTIGTAAAQNARLYSPRWNKQPNAMDVYLAVDSKFYKLNGAKTAFDLINSSLPTGGEIGLGGDTRKLWLTIDRKWYYSNDIGVTFTYQLTTDCYYGAESEGLHPQYRPGVNPENPDVFIGGATFPISAHNGGATQNNDAKNYWARYQDSVGDDLKLRINYHPDIHASQFFYDKAGKLFSLRSTDGGVFRSYNEWQKTSFPDLASIQNGVFYNISLFDIPSQETYRGSFIYGYQNSSHLTVGTQDQGWQNTRSVAPTNDMYSWDQVGGGDGPCCITGDGKIGWRFSTDGMKEFKRIQLYDGTTYRGLSGTGAKVTDFTFTGSSYFTPSVGDWSDGNRIWVLGQTLRRIEYNTSTAQTTALEKNLSGTNHYIQGVAQSRVNASLVYAMQNGNVYKSTDRGTNWTQVADQAATGMSGTSKNNRGMGWSSPLNQNIILFASESGTAVKTVFSKNGGTTWTNVSGSGANLFPAAQVNGMAGTADGKMVFASTNMGPYVFIVNEEKWYPLAIADDVPLFWGQIVYCVKYGNKEIVRFSTWGQGVWDFELNYATGLDNQHADNMTFNLFPNPAKEIIYISCSGSIMKNASISIYDELGKIVKNQKITEANESIDISHFSPGVYLISISNGEQHGRKKFIKSN